MSTPTRPARTPKRRVRELEVVVVQARRDTPDTTTLFMSAGDEPTTYEAGHFCTIDPHQFGELEHFTAYLEDQKGQREKPRAYSMASAPHEQHLAITIKEERYESGQTPYPPLLSPLLTYYVQAGRRLVISGFTGAYTFPPDVCDRTDHILHVCAGSGIVPNRSLIKESLHRGDPLRHTLLFSNKTRRDIIYYEEFEALRAQYPSQLDVVHCITREEPVGIRGARNERISGELLREVAPDPSAVLAYSCGPGITPYERRAARAQGETPEPRFVENMVALLRAHGLDKGQIRQESWG